MHKGRSEESGVLEVVRVPLFDLSSQVELRCGRICHLILRLDVGGKVIGELLHEMIFAIDEDLHCLDSLIPVGRIPLPSLVVLQKRSTNESFADVGNGFVSKRVVNRAVSESFPFTLDQL